MEQFFNDSRLLFKDHSKGSTEFKVDTTSELGATFIGHLTGYYVVQVEEKNDTIRPNYSYSDSIMRLLSSTGKIIYTSQPYNSKETAIKLKNKWKKRK
jgi:hypothetical protein